MLIPPIFFNLYSPLHFVIWYVSRWWINSPKGDRPEVKARLNQVVSEKLDQDRLRELLEERVLARDSMDFSKVQKIREDIERAEARRLQPHFYCCLFLGSFPTLRGYSTPARAEAIRNYQRPYPPPQPRSLSGDGGANSQTLRAHLFQQGTDQRPR